jgi:hypothetical protein
MFSPLSILTEADDGGKQRYINNENWSDDELLRIHLYIIWHYCIISHIKLWLLKMTSSHKYALKYRQWSKVFGHFRFFLYISYKTSFLIYYLEVNSCPISIIILSTKAERYVVYSSNFEITFLKLFFSNRHDLNTGLNNLSAKVLLLQKKWIRLCLTCVHFLYTCHINPRPILVLGPSSLGIIWIEGWYDM